MFTDDSPRQIDPIRGPKKMKQNCSSLIIHTYFVHSYLLVSANFPLQSPMSPYARHPQSSQASDLNIVTAMTSADQPIRLRHSNA